MKKIVVISDTHGNFSCIEKLLGIMKESDYVFHLGDFEKDILEYKKELSNKIISVKGNCDGGGDYALVNIENIKILLVHGDGYSVKNGVDRLYYLAKELQVNAVLYGHTHNAIIEKIDDIWFVNPGCMSSYTQNSYCYIVVHEDKFVAKIVYLNSVGVR